jgi:hypothetical protein
VLAPDPGLPISLDPIGCCTPSGCVVEGFCGLVDLGGEPFCGEPFGNVDPAPFGGEPFGKVDPADGRPAAALASSFSEGESDKV